MGIEFIKPKTKDDRWFVPPGLKDKTKSHETDRTATDGPQGGPSFTSGSDQPSMPGNSTGDTSTAMGGAPGSGYDASWGISVSTRKIPAPKKRSLWAYLRDLVTNPLGL